MHRPLWLEERRMHARTHACMHVYTHAHTHCQRHKHKHAQTLQCQIGCRGNKFTAFVNLATQLHTIIICMCLFLCIYWNDWWYSGFVFVQKEVCIFWICILEGFFIIFSQEEFLFSIGNKRQSTIQIQIQAGTAPNKMPTLEPGHETNHMTYKSQWASAANSKKKWTCKNLAKFQHCADCGHNTGSLLFWCGNVFQIFLIYFLCGQHNLDRGRLSAYMYVYGAIHSICVMHCEEKLGGRCVVTKEDECVCACVHACMHACVYVCVCV